MDELVVSHSRECRFLAVIVDNVDDTALLEVTVLLVRRTTSWVDSWFCANIWVVVTVLVVLGTALISKVGRVYQMSVQIAGALGQAASVL
jgi:hypothetical protein